MPEKGVYVFVPEGFADWEPAHAVAELRRHGGYRVESVGLTAAPLMIEWSWHVERARSIEVGGGGRRGEAAQGLMPRILWHFSFGI